MTKSKRVLGITMAVMCGLFLGCTDSEDPPAGGAGGAGAQPAAGTGSGGMMAGTTGGEAGTTGGMMAGTTGGAAGTGVTPGEVCTNTGETDGTCPDMVGPFEGECSPKGMCCHRSSNTAKLSLLGPDDPAVMEYRVTQSSVLNHPLTTGLSVLLDAATARAKTCAGEQCLLWRFEQPRMGGALVPGPGHSTVAIGAYNCNGTFSYYNDSVAPMRAAEGFLDANRWGSVTADTTVDPTKEGVERTKIAWATNPNQNLRCSPFFMAGSDMIDWELCSYGFEMLDFDTSAAGEDCQGSWGSSMWMTPGKYQVFIPLANNNKDIIDAVMQNFSQLLSYSVLQPDDKMRDPTTDARCMPDDPQPVDPTMRQCKWVKLPDSLCPETEAERAMWRCHLGAKGNPNASQEMTAEYPSDEELNCTDTAPTAALNPDMDPTVSKGQCCDPLAMGTNGLPACNAFRIVNQYAAAAAEITDDPKSDFPEICTGM